MTGSCVGPNVDFHESVLAQGPRVIAQLNRRMVAPAGSLLMNPAQIDVLIENDISGPALIPATVMAQEIGRLVAQSIRDGDCLQTDWRCPAAILNRSRIKMIWASRRVDRRWWQRLSHKPLTARKAIDTGRHITGMALEVTI